MNKRFLILLLCLLLAGSTATAAFAGLENSPETGKTETAPKEAAPEPCVHNAYLSGSGEALPAFFPNQPLTRSQAAQMIAAVLPELPELPVSATRLPDLPVPASGSPEQQEAAETPPPERQETAETEKTPPEQQEAAETEKTPPEHQEAAETAPPERQEAARTPLPEHQEATETPPPERQEATESAPPERQEAAETEETPPERQEAAETSPERQEAAETVSPKQQEAAETAPPERQEATETAPPERQEAAETEEAPDALVTRAEFTTFLAGFYGSQKDGLLPQEAPLFQDVPETHPAAQAVRTARALGWVQGSEDGCFRPDDAITRVEAVVMLNRALGRTPDRAYINRTHPVVYRDVTSANWYYYEIVEASVPHEAEHFAGLETWTGHTMDKPLEGFYQIEGQLYYYDSETQEILRNQSFEYIRFSASGQCFADRPRLDGKLREIVAGQGETRVTLAEMEQALAEEAAAILAEWSLILINGDNPLPEGFAVPELAALGNGYQIDSRVYPALQSMLERARSAGYSPMVCSAYRTWEKQSALHQQKIQYYRQRGYSQEKAADAAAFWVARPGTSEHQAGLAVDIVDSAYPVLNKSQERRPVQKWLMEHCAEYGFILRYPTDKSGLTGVGYEPWHYRYVGVEAAKEIMSRGICLEEYLAAPAETR